MKLIECANAYMALGTLMKEETDFKSAYAVARLRKKLEPHAMYYAKEEMDLVRRFSRKDGKGEPVFLERERFAFESAEAAESFNRLRDELGAVEIDKTVEPIRVRAPERITPEALCALEGLVEFEEEKA